MALTAPDGYQLIDLGGGVRYIECSKCHPPGQRWALNPTGTPEDWADMLAWADLHRTEHLAGFDRHGTDLPQDRLLFRTDPNDETVSRVRQVALLADELKHRGFDIVEITQIVRGVF